MRMFAQDGAFHRRVRLDETADPEARRRLRELETVDRLREHMPLLAALATFDLGAARTTSAGSGCAKRGRRGWCPVSAGRSATRAGGGRGRTRRGCWRYGWQQSGLELALRPTINRLTN